MAPSSTAAESKRLQYMRTKPPVCCLQGAFLHRDYLQLYTAGMPSGVLAYVDARRKL